jgi:hypothetical protein
METERIHFLFPSLSDPHPFWVTSPWNSTEVSGVQQPSPFQYKYRITDLIIVINGMSKCIYNVIIIILI